MQFGIRSVTMDDIARDLGMSKKTLYSFVTNKADLVDQSLRHILDAECVKVAAINENAGNAIDEMVEMGKYIIDMLGNLSAATLNDLKKYHRESWRLLERHREEFVYSVIVKNIKNGMREGLYRPNLKPELIAHFYISQADLVTDGKLYMETGLTKMRDVYVEMLKYHIYGIASDEGIEYLKKILDKKK